MPVFVGWHLCKTQNCILTLQTMIMGLFPTMLAICHSTNLTWSKFLKSCSLNWVQFLMLPSMGDYLICVSTHKITFQAMKMRRFVLSWSWKKEYSWTTYFWQKSNKHIKDLKLNFWKILKIISFVFKSY